MMLELDGGLLSQLAFNWRMSGAKTGTVPGKPVSLVIQSKHIINVYGKDKDIKINVIRNIEQ